MKNEQKILNYIKEKEFAEVSELSKTFGASESTIRRKLSALEKKGLIKRTHGGANIVDTVNSTFNFTLRIHKNAFEKRMIALRALKLIKEGDVIFLDCSTTTYFLAEYLNEFKNVKVITNSIDTLNCLAKKNVQAISTGGTVSKENNSALIGNAVIDFIRKFNANVCFFSCQSLSRDGTISDCYLDENYIRAAMIEHSEKSVFLCDSTKADKSSPYVLCNAKNIDVIVADKALDDYLDESVRDKITVDAVN